MADAGALDVRPKDARGLQSMVEFDLDRLQPELDRDLPGTLRMLAQQLEEGVFQRKVAEAEFAGLAGDRVGVRITILFNARVFWPQSQDGTGGGNG